jgi:hypothetical protein
VKKRKRDVKENKLRTDAEPNVTQRINVWSDLLKIAELRKIKSFKK